MMRRARLAVGVAGLLAGLALAADGAVALWRADQANRAIAALMAGQDVGAGSDAPVVLAARARLLIARRNLEGAQAVADRLAAAPARVREPLLYALGNAQMRHALDVFKSLPFRMVSPIIGTAKGEYRQALALDPGDWDARYDYSLAAALVRDTESAQATSGDEMAHERAAWPDIPGAPNGMP